MRGSSDAASTRHVVASFYPLEFAAKDVGDGSVSVTNLTPPGAEPHDIELTARDVGRIQDADVVLYLDSGFRLAVEDAVREPAAPRWTCCRGCGFGGPPTRRRVRIRTSGWILPYAGVVRRIGRTLGAPARASALGARRSVSTASAVVGSQTARGGRL